MGFTLSQSGVELLIPGLAPGQRNRLIALARAGETLPWTEGDADLAKKHLVRKYLGIMDEEFAHLTGLGIAAAKRILRP